MSAAQAEAEQLAGVREELATATGLSDKRGAGLVAVCGSVHGVAAEFEGLLSGDLVDEEQLAPLHRANGKLNVSLNRDEAERDPVLVGQQAGQVLGELQESLPTR